MLIDLFLDHKLSCLLGLGPHFYARHGMPARTSYEKGVLPSVRPSVKRVICDKTKESCDTILVPHERSLTLVL